MLHGPDYEPMTTQPSFWFWCCLSKSWVCQPPNQIQIQTTILHYYTWWNKWISFTTTAQQNLYCKQTHQKHAHSSYHLIHHEIPLHIVVGRKSELNSTLSWPNIMSLKQWCGDLGFCWDGLILLTEKNLGPTLYTATRCMPLHASACLILYHICCWWFGIVNREGPRLV